MAEQQYSTVLITGASSGIGRAMSLWFAKRGAKVFAAARREAQLRSLADAAGSAGGRVEPVVLDCSRESDTVRRVEELDDACGGLDLVIANAGVGDPTPARLAGWSDVERVLRINVMGAAATISAVLPRMVARDRGHVVGVSSVASYRGLGAYSAYCGSKAFLSTFLESLRVDLRGTAVRVTCIEPGFVKSEMTARIEGRAPMPFIADVEDAAEVFGRAIVRGNRRCAYPRIHALSSRAIACVPAAVYEPLAQRASRPQIEMFESERAAANAKPSLSADRSAAATRASQPN
jgi:short-subunit dehydrogenase